MRTSQCLAVAIITLGAWLAPRDGLAASKEECLDAHGRGQDLRDAGRLTSARQTFLACAQSSCPALIQADCARFGEELDRLVPSVSFAARDASGNDLPDTSVYVDDQLVTLRLDDGKSYDLDPGKHAVRFVHGDHESAVTVVLSEGEKGRGVGATFVEAPAVLSMPVLPPPVHPRRPLAPLFVAGLGAAAVATGVALLIVGNAEVPADCSIGSKQCVAPPGDPSIDQAHRGVTMANVGLAVGAGGLALLTTGVVWYVLKPAHPHGDQARASGVSASEASAAPWFGDRSAGLALSTRF